jgi:hypothetical protein
MFEYTQTTNLFDYCHTLTHRQKDAEVESRDISRISTSIHTSIKVGGFRAPLASPRHLLHCRCASTVPSTVAIFI